jgi:hypothetical protein
MIMRSTTTRLVRMGRIVAPLTLAAASACVFFFPFSHENLGETRVRALCHFAFACCTPIERQLFSNAPHRDEGACIDETLEDQGIGFLLNIDALAKDAVSRGAAVYDGEAAERCTKPQLDAINQCDVEKLVDAAGNFDLTRFVFLTDASDPECVALASRNYVRGQVDDGDECFSSFDCKDFGNCVLDEEDVGEVITTRGSCVVPHAEGDECDDGVACQPGLACVADGDGTLTCEESEPAADGEPCAIDADCESGNCEEVIGNGTCLFGGEPCVDDVDCATEGDVCNGEFVDECAPVDEVSVEVCDGKDG